MATFPTTKTVPLDKDIGVVSPLSSYIGTTSREQLSIVLATIDAKLLFLDTDYNTKINSEAATRLANDNNLQTQLNNEIANRIADVNTEETRATAAENLEIANRAAADTRLNNAIESDRSPLRVTFSSSATYSISSATASRTLGDTGSVQNSLGVTSGVYQSDFAGCSVNFLTGVITYNAGSLGTPANGIFSLPTLTGQGSKWVKASLVLLPTSPDTVIVTFGSTFGSSAAATPSPVVTGGVPIAVIALQVNSGGTAFNTGSQTNITQFAGAGSGGGSGSGSGSPIDPQPDESFLYYTRSDFAVDKKNFVAASTGTDQILGLGKLTLNAGQYVTSTDLTGSLIRTDAATINYAQARLLYNTGKVDYSPTVEMSIDGGNSWAGAPSVIAAQGNQVVVDFVFQQNQSLFNAGNPNGSVVSGQKVAAVITPSYRNVLSSFQAYLKTSSTTGTVTGRIYKVSSGIPSILVASSYEVYTASQDITATSSWKTFSFAPVTLDAASSYALIVDGAGLSANISWEQVTTAAATSISSATHNGSGWSANSAKLASIVYGTGLDVRLKITSNTAASELLGFGVNMVLDTQTGYSGEQSWEVRTLTTSEARTGLITLASCRYTPGAHQLHANVGGHDFMAPDFVEVSTSSIQFPANYLQAGDTVRFYVSYGIVDGSAVSLQKINTIYEAVVGNAAQVAAGVATYTSIQTAINSVTVGGKITLLQGTFTENVTVNKEVCIEGKGRSSIINGTINFTSSSTGSMLKFAKILNDVTIDLAAQAVNVTDNWLASGKSVTGGTNCLILNIGEN